MKILEDRFKILQNSEEERREEIQKVAFVDPTFSFTHRQKTISSFPKSIFIAKIAVDTTANEPLAWIR